MKKIVIVTMTFLGLIVVVSNVCSIVFLFMNVTEINAATVAEGAIITNGLTIISLAATVWIGISIYNAIEKKEFEKIKEEVSHYSSLSNQVQENTRKQLVNQMYKTGDVTCDYIAKCFDKDTEISDNRYVDLLTIDILLHRAYVEQNAAKRAIWSRVGIEKIDKYKGKFTDRCGLENSYLNYREADFLFYIADICTGEERFNTYEHAKDLFIKSAKCMKVSFKDNNDIFNEEERELRILAVYFANAIGQCYANMMLAKSMSKELFNEMKIHANKYLEYAVRNSVFCGEREVYYRNYGCFIENTASNIQDLEKAYEQYKKAFCIDSTQRNIYYVLISNLNKRIRDMLKVEIRTPQKNREVPIYLHKFNEIENKDKIVELINEMKVYIEFAIDRYPDDPSWYAFSIYRRIYKMCIYTSFEKLKEDKHLWNIKNDMIKVEMLGGQSNLCKVAKLEVADLISYYIE